MTTGRINQVTTFPFLALKEHNCPIVTNEFAFSVRSSSIWLKDPDTANKSFLEQTTAAPY